jgi:hypothetical protein
VNFQVTVLKVLASYPDGFASLNDLKHDMAILATSGKDWTERTKRLAARLPNLEIFSQGLVVRLEDGWRITQRGRSVLVRPQSALFCLCLSRLALQLCPPSSKPQPDFFEWAYGHRSHVIARHGLRAVVFRQNGGGGGI